ncbi:MAG TPA: C4-type zinc ribbon domain-containing protein [Acidimicrobiales bacterium]|nr:C4-type zinc ribbon domain-containing protein [Acidimicrobiales bacterium]
MPDVADAPRDQANDPDLRADDRTAGVNAADVCYADDRASCDRARYDRAQETLTAPQFEALLAVQDLDTALDQHAHRRANLPELAELVTVDGQLAAFEARLADAAARRDEVAARQDRLEGELMATENRIAEVNKRLYGGTVSASRELIAMAADVKSMEARAAELEERGLEVLEEREPLDAEVLAIEGEKASLLAARAEIEAQLAAALAVVDAEVDALNQQRADAVAGVPEDLLAVYTRLRARLGGIGAARLVGSLCSGCHLTLPATELDQLKRQPPDALIFCDQCGRILVR